MIDTLQASDFEFKYDAEHTFSFTESEDGVIMAYGHPDREVLAKEITEYDTVCAGERYRDDVYPTDPADIRQTYAVLVEGASGDEWRIKWGQDADAPGAFPVSVVSR